MRRTLLATIALMTFSFGLTASMAQTSTPVSGGQETQGPGVSPPPINPTDRGMGTAQVQQPLPKADPSTIRVNPPPVRTTPQMQRQPAPLPPANTSHNPYRNNQNAPGRR